VVSIDLLSHVHFIIILQFHMNSDLKKII